MTDSSREGVEAHLEHWNPGTRQIEAMHKTWAIAGVRGLAREVARLSGDRERLVAFARRIERRNFTGTWQDIEEQHRRAASEVLNSLDAALTPQAGEGEQTECQRLGHHVCGATPDGFNACSPRPEHEAGSE